MSKEETPIEAISKEIEKLEKSLREIQVQKHDADKIVEEFAKKERELRIEIAIHKTGLSIGTKVIFKGKAATVSGYDGSIRPIVNWTRKDGRIGERSDKIWNAELSNVTIVTN